MDIISSLSYWFMQGKRKWMHVHFSQHVFLLKEKACKYIKWCSLVLQGSFIQLAWTGTEVVCKCFFFLFVCLFCFLPSMQYYYSVNVCAFKWLCECFVSHVYCICQWTAILHSSLIVTCLQTQADPCIGKYKVLFITIVTFYNVFFYHILYVRNNIKSHFQIWTVCLITKKMILERNTLKHMLFVFFP